MPVGGIEIARSGPVVCRCEGITLDEIIEAVRSGAITVDAVKRKARAGMGLCQGRTCGRLVAGVIARETGLRLENLLPARVRPPARPVKLGVLAKIPDTEAGQPGNGEFALDHASLAVLPGGMGSLVGDCKFVVIGGGVIGSSITYHLARLGHGVTLLERNDIACETSGASQAWVWVHPKKPPWYMCFNWESAKLFPRLGEELGVDIEYRQTGGMVAFFTGEERAQCEEIVLGNRSAGLDVTLLSRGEALTLEPLLSPRVVGATYSPVDGNVNPFRLVQGYAQGAANLGAHICTHAEVTRIEQSGSHGWVVHTRRGILHCQTLIVAAGVATPGIVRMVSNRNLPVEPVRGQVLVTEALPPAVRLTHQGVRQTLTGQITLGYLSEKGGGYRNVNTLGGIGHVARKAVEYMPFLADVFAIRAFSGLRPMPADHLPILGWVHRNPHMFVAVTHSGITLSPLIGRLVADEVAGRHNMLVDRYVTTRF